jgi:hypothetical protein
MPRLFLGLLAVTIVVIAIAFFFPRNEAPGPGPDDAGPGTSRISPTPGAGSTAVADSTPGAPDGASPDPAPGAQIVRNAKPDPRFTRLPDGRSILNDGYSIARSLHRSTAPPIEDVEAVDAIFAQYRWAYRTNPEGGENEEIMAGLLGENEHQVVFFPPDHTNLDDQGRLLDRWGQAYFFHKLTDTEMDIVSAGPDQRFWTADDLSLGLAEDFESASIDDE